MAKVLEPAQLSAPSLTTARNSTIRSQWLKQRHWGNEGPLVSAQLPLSRAVQYEMYYV